MVLTAVSVKAPVMRRPRIGALLMPVKAYSEMKCWWRDLEASGFDDLWLPDRVASYVFPEAEWLECWALLAGMAESTQRARIGTLVTSLRARNPVLIAKWASTIDHISNGRLELGIGTGLEREDELLGVSSWQARETTARLREALILLDATLRGVEWRSGEFYRTSLEMLRPLPCQKPRPPLIVAALGPKAIAVAAERADAWNFYFDGDGTEEDAFARAHNRIAEFRTACTAAGRLFEGIRRSLLVFSSFLRFDVWSSSGRLDDFLERCTNLGVSEFVFEVSDRKHVEQMTQIVSGWSR